jgi:hypothetical protein
LVVLEPFLVLVEPDEFISRGRVLLFAPLFLLFGILLGIAIHSSRRAAPACQRPRGPPSRRPSSVVWRSSSWQ